jgi:hypothetical protein
MGLFKRFCAPEMGIPQSSCFEPTSPIGHLILSEAQLWLCDPGITLPKNLYIQSSLYSLPGMGSDYAILFFFFHKK